MWGYYFQLIKGSPLTVSSSFFAENKINDGNNIQSIDNSVSVYIGIVKDKFFRECSKDIIDDDDDVKCIHSIIAIGITRQADFSFKVGHIACVLGHSETKGRGSRDDYAVFCPINKGVTIISGSSQSTSCANFVCACTGHCATVGWVDRSHNHDTTVENVRELVPPLGVLVVAHRTARHVNVDAVVNAIKGIGTYGWRHFNRILWNVGRKKKQGDRWATLFRY